MIIVTGGAGFIGSCLLWKLNEKGHHDILVVDRLRESIKWTNLRNKFISDYLHSDKLFDWLDQNTQPIEAIFHLGACSSTEEKRVDYIMDTNYHFSQKLWLYAVQNKIPFIYASSAATYGGGEHGFDDRDDIPYLMKLNPLNPYAYSKVLFDRWAISQKEKPLNWNGLKFFNVYGPNEAHKGRQASMAYHLFNQVVEGDGLRLYKSYQKEYADGEQVRDFVYVKDVVELIYFFFQHPDFNGIYNVGSGVPNSFNALAKEVINSSGKEGAKATHIEYIDMPTKLKPTYQYYTKANLDKLEKTSCKIKFHSLKEGVEDYVKNYLLVDKTL